MLVLQADQFQQFANFALALFLRYAGDLQRQLDVLPHGLGRHQVEMLEDHADTSAQFHQAIFIEPADVDLVDQHPSAGGLFQTVDGTDQR